MAINDVKLQQAVTAVKNGMDVAQAAKEFGVEPQALANAINPNGGGKPEDSFGKELKFDKVYTNADGSKVNVAKVATYNKPSGRSIEIFVDDTGKRYLQYKAADGTTLKESYFKDEEAKFYEKQDTTTSMEKAMNWILRNFGTYPLVGRIVHGTIFTNIDMSDNNLNVENSEYFREHFQELMEDLW